MKTTHRYLRDARLTLRYGITIAIILNIFVSADLTLAQPILRPGFTGAAPTPSGVSVPTIGIDCGLGTREGVANPGSTPPVIGDGTVLDSGCTWSGDADSATTPDGTLEPLVSDNPESGAFVGPPGTGGGFSTEVRLFNLPPPANGCPDPNCINGFDIAVRFDPRYLNAQLFDLKGLPFGDNPPAGSGGALNLLSLIDNANGVVRLAQVILGNVTVPADLKGGVTLFRIRFDVVGVGTSTLHFPCNLDVDEPCEITNPGLVSTGVQDGSFNSEPFFDVSANLNWNIFWSYLPNPMVPGSPITFAAAASCTGPGCGSSLTLTWDVNSDGIIDGTSSTITVTPPPPSVSRVKLAVSDGAGHVATAVRRPPLVIAVQGPGTISKGTSGSWTGRVLGGNPPYVSGSWRFCPAVTTVGATQVCTNPSPTATTADLADNLDARANTYNFAGVFANSLKLTDTASREIQVSSATGAFLVTVIGAPAAYTVTVANQAKADVGASVTVTARLAYFGDLAVVYDSNSNTLFDAGETVIVGVAPATGTATKDDPKVKYRDANNNNARDSSEAVVYDANGNSMYDSGELVIAGSAPSVGASLKDDMKVRYVDTNNDSVFDSNGYPYVGRSSTFSAAFDFGDGSTSTVTGGLTLSATHSYAEKGTFTIRVTTQETAVVAVSKIQETGTSSLAVNPLVLTPDFTTTLSSPLTGLPATFTGTVSGGTSPYSFSWDLGDGTTDVGETIAHTYYTGGVKTVVLTVRDANGATATVSRSIVVIVNVGGGSRSVPR